MRYVKEGRFFFFVTSIGQRFRRFDEVSVLIDLKHGILLAHGDRLALQEKYDRLARQCTLYGIPEQFRRCVKLVTKHDWDMDELNAMVETPSSLPRRLYRRYLERRAVPTLVRVPVREMTPETEKILRRIAQGRRK